MKTVEISEIITLLENYSTNEQPLVITRNGQPVAVLLPVEDADIESVSLSLNSKFTDMIEKSRESQKLDGRFFLEDINFFT
jgi:PHD/YefM family antitoxin component YafN of YafNO toxin-antitoxin module